jgi:uncharacterized protein (UPF0548 family)
VQILIGGAAQLEAWEARPIAPQVAAGPRPGDHQDRHERTVGREPPGPPLDGGVHRQLAAAILDYRVFPVDVLTAVVRRTPVQVGDTVGARFHLLPGVDVFFASRVYRVFDEAAGGLWRSGFTYRTIVGHPELGEETFCVEKELASGAITVALRAWSRPGTFLARALKPLVRRWQLDGSRRALDELERIAGIADA